MSNWHARVGDVSGNAFQIIFHIPIPATNNRVGVPYRTALVGSGLGGTTIMLEGVAAGQITTAEKASITSGAIYEYVETFYSNPGETSGALQTRIDARYTALVTELQNRLANQLTYWGHAHDAP